jgi:hypothetical protein
MAFRIHESVVRGEVDNQMKGLVRGKVWLEGRTKPIVLKETWKQVDGLGLEESADKDLEQFVSEFQTTSAKLAGGLDTIAHGVALPDPAFTVAYLKRALDHLHRSRVGLEAVAPKKLLPRKIVTRSRKELFEIREGILRLMDDFRGRS